MAIEQKKCDKLFAELDCWIQRIERLIIRLARHTELMEDSGASLQDELRRFRDWLAAHPCLAGNKSVEGLLAKHKEDLRRIAATGSTFELRDVAGTTEIRVGTGAWFPLPRRLKELVVVLTTHQAFNGHEPAWIPRPEVRAMFEEKYGRVVTAQALTERIRCLRKLFESRGINRHLLETRPKRGVRLWLHRDRRVASDALGAR